MPVSKPLAHFNSASLSQRPWDKRMANEDWRASPDDSPPPRVDPLEAHGGTQTAAYIQRISTRS